jgi:hypothetical protein
MSKITGKSSGGKRKTDPIDKPCKVCKCIVPNVDRSVDSITCYKCVAKSLSPNAIFVDDLSPEEFRKLLTRTNK